MIRTILVPIDVAKAEAGAAALGLARDLAEKYGSKLILLHVLEEVPGFVKAQLPAGVHAKAFEDASASLNAFAAEQGRTGTADVLLREGNPSVQILEFANEIGADMIVIPLRYGAVLHFCPIPSPHEVGYVPGLGAWPPRTIGIWES